jgi:hypothetical protein
LIRIGNGRIGGFMETSSPQPRGWKAVASYCASGECGEVATGSATGKDLLHTRLGYGECSRFIADPLLWKCG